MEIKAETLADAWPQILQFILDSGIKRHTIHNNANFLEATEPIVLTLRRPERGRIPEGFNWTAENLKLYANQVFDKADKGFAYTYGERLNRCDQIDQVIAKIERDDQTKQAVAVTWIPEKDNESNDPPCLMLVDFKVYNNRLQLVAYFRSNDYYAALPANVFLLTELAHYISIRALGHSGLGPLTVISNGAHIYDYAINDAQGVVANGINSHPD